MPDLPDRANLESTFAEQLGRSGRRLAKELLELTGEDARELTLSEWRDVGQRYTEVIQPQLESIYQHGAGSFYDHLGLGRDDDAIGSYAQTWARDHASSLTEGLLENSRTRFGTLRDDFLNGRINVTRFREGVYELFSASRAEMIAATETTRAAVAAELQVIEGLRGYGLQYVAVWQTSNDSLMCPICAPRHGKQRGVSYSKSVHDAKSDSCGCDTCKSGDASADAKSDAAKAAGGDAKASGDAWWDYPPSHPRCRCVIQYIPSDVEGLTGG